ncbi:MAG: MBL fold metallo-hydrolase [Desulfitobacteriaceae bacterium]
MPEQVEKGIFRISIPIPLVFGPVNVYFLPGRIPTLIDAGFNTSQAWEWLTEEIRETGYDIADLKQVLLTHGHVDHCGLTERIRTLTGARIVMHSKEWEGIRAFQEPSTELDAMMEKQFALWGIPGKIQQKIASFRQQLRAISQVPADGLILVQDGESIQAGDFLLRAVHCPGHTPGQLVWYAEEQKLAFTGDHVLKTISPNPDLYLPPQKGGWSGLPDYLESLTKVSLLEAEICFPGHGEAMTDLKGRVDQIRLSHEERKERIVELFDGKALTLNELTLRFLTDIKREPDASTFFLGLRETLGHLYLLEMEGRLGKEMVGEVLLYSVKG